MALIFIAVGTYCFYAFEFHQFKLPWLHRQWRGAPKSPDLNLLDYQVWGDAGVLSQAATEAKNSSQV